MREASLRTFVKWAPSAEVVASLSANWAQLPPATQKTLDEFLYGKIEYTFAPVTPTRHERRFGR